MKMVMYVVRRQVWLLGGALLVAFNGLAQAQDRARIYTCVDATGRTLTSDRPIPQCNDRPQRILDGVTGHQQGIKEPSYTQAEREAIEREKKREQDVLRAAKDKRQRERVLLMRYPNEEAHNQARESAKESLVTVITAANLRLAQIRDAKIKLDKELEFYDNDIAKAPPVLKRQFADNQQDMQDQQTFIDGKQEEVMRVDRQFDQELNELKQLW
ncbi:DUF4124 domain-containing protein [Lampropedia puyangensis]|uniref:DUF4124 domain-containing protein n=1 Tax=Lampropedia puyangensis TaxID=1330072 RepID=A0A4V6T2T6_9BURK|nr:DUF4124 domain-containing protein [Lampropedia puyangensis]THU04576.1 DUF4124 domain-containing protein [Lampropedia puyangensis]